MKTTSIFRFFWLCILLISILPYPSPAKDRKKEFSDRWIALVIEFTSSDYNRRLVEGVREEAEALGLRLEVQDAKENKASMELSIDDVSFRNADGLLICHGSPDILTPPVKRSLRRGIPIVSIHNNLILPGVTLLDQDEPLLTELIINRMIADTGGKANFILIWFDGYMPMIKRKRVYDRIMYQQSGLRELARFGTAGEGTALHTEATLQALLGKYPVNTVDAVLATWDEYAKGAARAIINAGRKEIGLYGINISDSVLQMLQDPDNPWVATVGVDSKIWGKVMVRMLAHALRGNKLPQHHSLKPVLISKSMLPTDKRVTMDDLPLYIPGWDKATTYPFIGSGVDDTRKPNSQNGQP